jgi:multicomponent Na+:H+ antiporter subunit E
MSVRASLMMRALAARFSLFLGAWFIIANWKLSDLPVGIAASALALWISLRFMPPSAASPRLVPSARLAFRLLSFSIVAGVDVARRALLPRVDLNPGFVGVALTLEPGTGRNAFLIYQGLQPGTLPTGAEGDRLQVHCLDISQPVVETVAADEALFKEAIGCE